MTDQHLPPPERRRGAETKIAAMGAAASVTALFSAAACCVLPLALAGLGIGAGGLAAFVPFRWPLTIAALILVAAGWTLYFRRRGACAADAGCTLAAPGKASLPMLCVATAIVALSALWGFVEQPLLRALGGA